MHFYALFAKKKKKKKERASYNHTKIFFMNFSITSIARGEVKLGGKCFITEI